MATASPAVSRCRSQSPQDDHGHQRGGDRAGEWPARSSSGRNRGRHRRHRDRVAGRPGHGGRRSRRRDPAQLRRRRRSDRRLGLESGRRWTARRPPRLGVEPADVVRVGVLRVDVDGLEVARQLGHLLVPIVRGPSPSRARRWPRAAARCRCRACRAAPASPGGSCRGWTRRIPPRRPSGRRAARTGRRRARRCRRADRCARPGSARAPCSSRCRPSRCCA